MVFGHRENANGRVLGQDKIVVVRIPPNVCLLGCASDSCGVCVNIQIPRILQYL